MSEDRRVHKRLQLTLSIAQPIRLELHTDQYDGVMPGIMVNLSAGGMAIIVFQKLQMESKIEFNLKFMGIEQQVKGKVLRVEERTGNTFIVGIQFDKVIESMKDKLGSMVEDSDICEIRYLVKLNDACFPKCSFRPLCAKRIKKDF